MQCAVVLRVGVTTAEIKHKHLQNLLIVSSLSQMHIYMNIKENFLSTTKFEWVLPTMATMAAGVCAKFPVERQCGCLCWSQSCRSRVKPSTQEMKKTMQLAFLLVLVKS